MTSSSCTTESGGRPPSRCDRFIDPRVATIRMPRRRGCCDLDVDRIFQPGREDIVVIGRGGATGQQQFCESNGGGGIDGLRCHARPDRIQRRQPAKQWPVHRGRVGAGQRLVEMVVRVDQPGQHDEAARVVSCDAGRCGFAPGRHQFGDASVPHHDATLRAVGQNRQRILQPNGRPVVTVRFRNVPFRAAQYWTLSGLRSHSANAAWPSSCSSCSVGMARWSSGSGIS